MPRSALPIAIVLLLAAACADTPPAAPADRADAPLLSRGTTPISLAVSVASDTALHRVTGDGLGDYVDGEQGVFAQIDDSGNLQFGSTAAPMVRRLVFDFGAPVGAASALAHGSEADVTSWKLKTNRVLATSSSPYIGDLGVNGIPASACYSATAAHAHPTLRFTAQYNSAMNAPSGQVRITRTSVASPSRWTMVTNDPTCDADVDVAAVDTQSLTIRNAKAVLAGTYRLPFAITLTAR